MDMLKQIFKSGIIHQIKNDEQIIPNEPEKGPPNTVCISAQHEVFPEIIRKIKDKNLNCIIGVTDIMTPEQCQEAVSYGANFIITPGINRTIFHWCKENGVITIPGCLTPTEIMQCLDMGYPAVCCYPTESKGGATALAMVKEQFPDVLFIAYGGITAENAQEYRDCRAADTVIVQ